MTVVSVGVVVVSGVSGTGKTTVGRALAARLRVPFADGDDRHPPANVEKMERGEPLTDEDRWPWLDEVGSWLTEHPDGGVIACSALRRTYRDRLRGCATDVRFLVLTGDPVLLADRQAHRAGHFMPVSLLASQLAAYEPLAPDEAGTTVDVDRSVDDVVREFLDSRDETT
ncbi:MAG: gluconokinase [Nocardioides sp.]